MFVNKIGNRYNNVNFQGYKVVTDSVGKTMFHFTFSYDYDNKAGNKLYIEFFDVGENLNNYGGIEPKNYDNADRKQLTKEGVFVEKSKLRRAYRLVECAPDGRVLHIFADSGNQYRFDGKEVIPNDPNKQGEFNVINVKGATSATHTQSMQIIPDSTYPEYKLYDYKSGKPGEIYVDKSVIEKQRWLDRSHSNMSGGNVAGVMKANREIAEMGADVLNTTPFTNGGIFSHSYSNINNNAIDESKGTPEDFANFVREKFVNGTKSVYDATLTSENLKGIHFQYMLRWLYELGVDSLESSQIVDEFFMFNAIPLLNMPFQYGILPKNALQYMNARYVNTPDIPVEGADGKISFVKNPQYDPDRNPQWQVYDKRYYSEAEVNDRTKILKPNDNPSSDGNVLGGKRSDQTGYAYDEGLTLKDWEEIKANMLRNQERNIPWYSTENLKTSRFTVGTVTQGVDTWDNNSDLARAYNVVTAVIEQKLQQIKDKDVADNARARFQRGVKQSLSTKLESLRYNLQKEIDIVKLTYAQSAEQIKSEKDLNRLIAEGKMSPKVRFTDEQIENIREGNWYKAEPWGQYDRNDTTVKALMKYPLDSINLANNTLGVLSSTYLAARGVDDDTVTKTRFELMQMGNPQVDFEHGRTYNELNNFYNNELRLLTDEVINSLNEKLPEKLIDEDGEYTEYGEYIVNLIAPEIVKFAVLKALGKEHCDVKMLENGDLTYDYSEIKDNTSLRQLGIDAKTPKEEALKLISKLKEVNLANNENISLLTESFMKKLEGTSVEGFRMIDAITKEFPVTIMRLDALKDTVDWDAVRALIAGYDTTIEDLVSVIKSIVEVVKSVNENIPLVPEFTDFGELQRHIGGSRFADQDDVIAYIMNKTGLNSEMGYSFFFDNLSSGNIWNLKDAFRNLIYKHDPDYVRSLVSFIGNHDKPRMATLYALNMGIFNTKDMTTDYDDNSRKHNQYVREVAMKIMHKVDSLDELSPEIRDNLNNPDYFKSVNPRALAMSELIRRSINEAEIDISNEEKALLYQAIADMTDGNYMGHGDAVKNSVEREIYKQIYGARDIEHNIHSIIDQAIYLAGLNNSNIAERFKDAAFREEFETKISRKALGPAMNKLAAIMEFSAALPGISTMYYGDNQGMTGYEDECRNPNLQNRNPMFDIENMPDGPMKEWHKEIMAKFEKGMQLRSAIGVDPINDGCCYELSAKGGDDKEINSVFTYLAHSDKGSVISILNYNGLGGENAQEKEVNYIAFPKDKHTSLPVGTILYNSQDPEDNSKYIVQYNEQEQEYRLYNEAYKQPIRLKDWTLVLTTTNVNETLNKIEEKANELMAQDLEVKKDASASKLGIKDVVPAVLVAACAAIGRRVGAKHLKEITSKLNRIA